MIKEQKNILVPVDFEEQSLRALEQSYNLAKLFNVGITILFVQEEGGMFDKFFSDRRDDFKATIQANLKALAEKTEAESNVKVQWVFAYGRVYSKIAELAKEIEASIVVMGTRTHAVEPGTKNMMGANTSRVIRSVSCPVITIGGQYHYSGCRTILLPLDLTSETKQKVGWAISIARLFKSRIQVVSALWSGGNKNVVIELESQLERVKKFIQSKGIEVSTEIIHKTEKEKTLVPMVVKYVKHHGDIDLVMILTQPEIGIKEFFVGSNAQEMIRSCPVPVMSIVPRELGFSSIMS